MMSCDMTQNVQVGTQRYKVRIPALCIYLVCEYFD